MFLEIGGLIVGLALLVASSERTVTYSIRLANVLKIPAFLIGVVLVSLGTDIPEIINSIISSYLGHGNINVGNALGSPLAQITLVLGLAVMFGGLVKVRKSQLITLGLAALGSTLLAMVIAGDGNVTQSDAAILIISYFVFLLFLCNCDPREIGIKKIKENITGENRIIIISLIIAILGVVAGSALVIHSAIVISTELGVSEYLISFFIIGLGTSLPELAVTLSAIRKKEYGLAIGDAFGSNITDLTLALGIGPLFFPNIVSGNLVISSGIYLLLATLIVSGLIFFRGKIDKKTAVILILIYLASYVVIPTIGSLLM